MEEIIIGRQGNQKMPISDPTVSRKHCRLTPNGDGTFTLENLSSLGTKVDGIDIIQTTVTPDSLIQLGPNFKAKLKDIIGLSSQSQASGAFRTTPQANVNSKSSAKSVRPTQNSAEQPKFSVSHLKRIWEEYESHNLEVAESQHKINLTRTGLGIFTMCAMPTLFFLGPVGYALTGIGIVGNIYSFIGMKNVDTPTTRKQRQDELEERWVCPNPKCGHTLLAKNYRALLRDYVHPGIPCPFCKCTYTE